MHKHDIKAEEYRVRARAASAAADSATLAQVRERHEQAARTWWDLADAETARAMTRRAPGQNLPTDPASPEAVLVDGAGAAT
jgi:hypothetical protein